MRLLVVEDERRLADVLHSALVAAWPVSEPPHVLRDAVLVFDFETELLTMEPRLGGERTVGLPIAQLGSDRETGLPADAHFIEPGSVRIGGHHAATLRPATCGDQ